MIWFSYFYLGSRMVLMDVQEDRTRGYRTFVASMSENPQVCFQALTPKDALNQLMAFLQAPRITFMPEQVEQRCHERSAA